jgi:hypothetical protein
VNEWAIAGITLLWFIATVAYVAWRNRDDLR